MWEADFLYQASLKWWRKTFFCAFFSLAAKQNSREFQLSCWSDPLQKSSSKICRLRLLNKASTSFGLTMINPCQSVPLGAQFVCLFQCWSHVPSHIFRLNRTRRLRYRRRGRLFFKWFFSRCFRFETIHKYLEPYVLSTKTFCYAADHRLIVRSSISRFRNYD